MDKWGLEFTEKKITYVRAVDLISTNRTQTIRQIPEPVDQLITNRTQTIQQMPEPVDQLRQLRLWFPYGCVGTYWVLIKGAAE